MKIKTQSFTFLFPRTGEIPIGGFKVIYEYANRLVADGYCINIVYAIVSRPVDNIFLKCGYYFCRFFRWLKYKYFKTYTPDLWFKTDKRINHLLRYSLAEHEIPQSDFIIATSWSTAVWLNKYKKIDNNRKLYFIQSFEDWNAPKDIVINTWKMDLRKIVIAPWLKEIALNLNEDAFLIMNGFDQKDFFITVPIKEKDKYSITMLWHDHPLKACHIGLEALNIVKKKFPQLTATFFGVPDRPITLPKWISYHKMPSKEILLQLYNKSAIFVGPSSKEGFCLTPPEAMLCGCAIACTNIGGYTVVAQDNKTALLSEPNNSNDLAINIIKLINNDDLRLKIAQNGNTLIKDFTWDKSYQKFLEVIKTI